MSKSAHETVTVTAAEASPIPSPWRLTELDAANAIFVIRGAWLFARHLDAARLRAGLAAVLVGYPHLTGRMARGREVELCNRGVPFRMLSRPDLSVADIVASPPLAHRLADRLHPSRIKKGTEPIARVTLTALRDGSLLNVSCSHGCVDGRAFYAFVQSWARACSGRAALPPALDSAVVPAPADRSTADVVAHAQREGWSRLRLGTILRVVGLSMLGRLDERALVGRFSARGLGRMRRAAANESGCPTLRTFDALDAHLTLACAKLVGLPPETECRPVIILDARGRVPSIPTSYAGNAPFAVQTASFAAGASLGEAAGRIHQSLAPFVTYPAPRLGEHLALARELVRHRAWWLPYDISTVYSARPTTAYVNNFSTLPIYDVDFGTEGEPAVPVRVIPHDLPDPVLIWPAAPDEDGVEVYLAGRYARALRGRAPDDPWFEWLWRFEPPAS